MMNGEFMNTLYIIGNGFDLAHGLKTNYWGLRKYIEEKDDAFLKQFEELYNIYPLDETEPWYTEEAQEKWDKSVNHILWSEFEKVIGNPNTTEMLELSKSATEGMPPYGIRDHMDIYWKEQFGFVRKLQDYVKEWIESIDTKNVVCRKKQLIKSDDFFFNFNYTDILEKVYGIENVLHIHGGVASICDIPPIMGHCNNQDIQQHRQWAREATDECAEAEASIQDAVADYLEAIYKNTQDQITLSQHFFRSINVVDRVVIIGWSAGDADIPYLQKIVQSVNPNTKWLVYWYDSYAYNSLTAAFKKEKSINADMIEYIQSDKFWDI